MIIRHHLAKGFNDIPLRNLRYATEHTQRGGVTQHTGWKIMGEYAGDKAKSSKHRYEVIFSPDELREFLEKGALLLKRFEDEQALAHLIDQAPATEGVSEGEGDDDEDLPAD